MHSRCPFQGATLYDDSVERVEILKKPSVTSHCAVLFIDIYFAFSSSEMNSELSNSGRSPLSIRLECFLSPSPLEPYIHKFLTLYLYISSVDNSMFHQDHSQNHILSGRRVVHHP